MVFRRIEHEEMGTAPVVRTLITLAIPAAASGVLQCLYSFVDMAYIGWLGKSELEAMSLLLSPTFIIFALGSAPAIGVGALVSRHLGAGEPDRARRVLDHALGMAACMGLLVSLLVLLNAEGMLGLYEPKAEVLRLATAYFAIVGAGAVFLHAGMVADAALRAQGNTITPMHVMMVANVANLILDPLFIFGPEQVGSFGPKVAWLFDPIAGVGLGMGVKGAAWATLITRTSMTLVLLGCLWSKRSRLKPSVPWRHPPRPRLGVVGKIYSIGLPSNVSHISMSVSFAIIMWVLNTRFPDVVGVIGIGIALERFAFVPIFGLSSAVMPMVGYNLGAGKFDRCKRTIFAGCVISSVSMGALGAVFMIWPRVFAGAITDSPLVLDAAESYMRINCSVYAIIGCDIMLSAGFQGFGRTTYAMFCQILRTLVARLPMVYFFAGWWGVTGVWWSFPISNVACFIMALSLMIWLLRKLERDATLFPTPEPGELTAAPSEIAESPDIP